MGNCDSLIVEQNYFLLRRWLAASQNLSIEAVRIFGFVGRRVCVRENHGASADSFSNPFDIGMHFHIPQVVQEKKELWVIKDNLFSFSPRVLVITDWIKALTQLDNNIA